MSSFSSEWSFPHVASDCGDLKSRSRERWRRRSSESRQANIKRLMRASTPCETIKRQPSHATQLHNCSKFISHSSRCNTSVLTFPTKEVKLLYLHLLLLFPVTSKLRTPMWFGPPGETEPLQQQNHTWQTAVCHQPLQQWRRNDTLQTDEANANYKITKT